MSVIKLITRNFRNLNDLDINFHSKFNFFVGDNGSGKSSLLEALFYLGHGKSFRTSKMDALICYEKVNLVVSIKNNNNCGLPNLLLQTNLIHYVATTQRTTTARIYSTSYRS